MQALEFYSQISLTDLSIPAFQRNLFINQGVAYVQQAQQAAEVFDLADILSTEALKFFNYARDLDCEIQKQDQEKTSEFMCLPNHLIEGWIHQAVEIRQAHDRKKEERKVVQWLEKGPQGSLTSGSNAISILQGALAQVQKSLRFLFVYDPSYGSLDVTTFKDLQTEVIRRAELFIPAVLQEQRELFSQRETASSRCQQQPWDQVIPLFDRGYRAIQSVQQDLGKFPKENLQALAKQEQAVQDWHDALQLLLHPPHPQPQKEPSENRPSEDIHETLRLIQEMHQEDQPLQETKNEEWHTW
jgi:hypothetical protein